ncbi:MAG: ATP-binding protein [Enterobacterales bacterium]|nr:ATP-binding protein [Enterobacterales bacterium]
MANLENIRILNRVRMIVIMGQILLILMGQVFLVIQLPLAILTILILCENIVQIYAQTRVKNKSSFNSFHLFSFIVFDSVTIFIFIYVTGGANNPFSYILLLPVALGSFMLSWRYLITLTIIQIMLYSILHLYQKPLLISSTSPIEAFHFHMLGMWINFSFTVVLIAIFGLLTRRASIEQDKRLQRLREKSLQEEQILSLAIMSASAAHEINTPLSTMAVIIDDLSHSNLSKEQQNDLKILDDALHICKVSIQGLNHKSEQVRQQLKELEHTAPLNRLFKTELKIIIDQWLVYRPQILVSQHWSEGFDSYIHPIDISLGQAISNLLDNSAEASINNQSNCIELTVSLNSDKVVIDIEDYGLGIEESVESSAGYQIQNSNKNNGLGWGLFLSNVTLERLDGSVQLLISKNGGAITQIILPLWSE